MKQHIRGVIATLLGYNHKKTCKSPKISKLTFFRQLHFYRTHTTMLGVITSHICLPAISLALVINQIIGTISCFKQSPWYSDTFKVFIGFGACINYIVMWLILPPWPIYWRELSDALLPGPIKLPEDGQWVCSVVVASNAVWIQFSWEFDLLDGFIRRRFRMRHKMIRRELYDWVAEKRPYQDEEERMAKSVRTRRRVIGLDW